MKADWKLVTGDLPHMKGYRIRTQVNKEPLLQQESQCELEERGPNSVQTSTMVAGHGAGSTRRRIWLVGNRGGGWWRRAWFP